MRISDWSSDVCSSDLLRRPLLSGRAGCQGCRPDREEHAGKTCSLEHCPHFGHSVPRVGRRLPPDARRCNHWNTAGGLSRLSEPSNSKVERSSVATARSLERVWMVSARPPSLPPPLPPALPLTPLQPQ